MKDFDNFQSWSEAEVYYFSKFRKYLHFDIMKLKLLRNQVYNYSNVGLLHVSELSFVIYYTYILEL